MKRCVLASAGAAALIWSGAATAQSTPTAPKYSNSFIFGDSLSDRGNAAEAVGYNFAYPPSFHDSFTNGDVAVQVMAQRLGFTADPSLYVTGFVDAHDLGLTPGNNYSVGGATSNIVGGAAGTNLPNQIGAFLAKTGGIADANALYTVFIGGNDVRGAAHGGNAALVTAGVNSEIAGITSLYNAGARNFLIVNVPDVSVIPEFQLGYPDQVTTAHDDSIAYNTGLASGVATLSSTYANGSFRLFDLYSFGNTLLANAGSLGITNTTTPCFTNTGIGALASSASAVTSQACGPIDPATNQPVNIGDFYYWDAIHPTAKVHAALGNALADYVLGVPEPSSWTMMIVGAGLIGAGLRRQRRRAMPAAA